MPNPFLSQFIGKFNTLKEKSSNPQTSVRLLICHKNIWGSDTMVSALQDANEISRNYWIEQIEVVQFSRAVLDSVIEQVYDLLIIDREMDRGCLSDTIRRVREADQAIKIVVSTSVRTPEINQLLADGQIDSVLLVPVQIIPMWKLLHELLSK